MQLIGEIKRSRVQEVRDRWKCEVINWGDEEVREFKRWEGERDRWRGKVEEQPWENFFFFE